MEIECIVHLSPYFVNSIRATSLGEPRGEVPLGYSTGEGELEALPYPIWAFYFCSQDAFAKRKLTIVFAFNSTKTGFRHTSFFHSNSAK